MRPEPKFKPGDKVISFKGEHATVIYVVEAPAISKSHRVNVDWDAKFKNPDKREYYEEVFRSAT